MVLSSPLFCFRMITELKPSVIVLHWKWFAYYRLVLLFIALPDCEYLLQSLLYLPFALKGMEVGCWAISLYSLAACCWKQKYSLLQVAYDWWKSLIYEQNLAFILETERGGDFQWQVIRYFHISFLHITKWRHKTAFFPPYPVSPGMMKDLCETVQTGRHWGNTMQYLDMGYVQPIQALSSHRSYLGIAAWISICSSYCCLMASLETILIISQQKITILWNKVVLLGKITNCFLLVYPAQLGRAVRAPGKMKHLGSRQKSTGYFKYWTGNRCLCSNLFSTAAKQYA